MADEQDVAPESPVAAAHLTADADAGAEHDTPSSSDRLTQLPVSRIRRLLKVDKEFGQCSLDCATAITRAAVRTVELCLL